MIHDLDSSNLRERANKILETKSDLTGLDYLNSWTKSSLDKLLATPAGFAILPIIGCASLAVLLQDGHFPFVNIGKGGNQPSNHSVAMWKIRTMIPNALMMEKTIAKDRPLCELKRTGTDPRITRIGSLLRKTTIDETPQVLQVVRGDLSLVGPRFLSISDRELYIDPYLMDEPYSAFQDLLDNGMKFGVTGLYVALARDGRPMKERIELEVLYGKNASLIADLRIIGLTFGTLLRGK